MQFKRDENLPVELADMARQAGHEESRIRVRK